LIDFFSLSMLIPGLSLILKKDLYNRVSLAIGGGLLLLLLLLKLNITSLIVLFMFNSFFRSMLNLRNKKSPPNAGGRLKFIIL